MHEEYVHYMDEIKLPSCDVHITNYFEFNK